MDSGLIVAARNLEKPRSFNPLKEFTGVYDEMVTEQLVGDFGAYIRVHLKFTDVEVIASDEPYDFPIADITMSYSPRQKSDWGVLLQSIPGDQTLDDILKSKLHLKFTPGHMQYKMDLKKDAPKDCWEIIEVVGQKKGGGKKDGLARALEILNGKTVAQFNQASLQDPIVRADATVQPQIMSKKFIPQMIETGAVTVDTDGIHHVIVTS